MGIKRDYALLRALAERIRITIATCTVYIQCKLPKKTKKPTLAYEQQASLFQGCARSYVLGGEVNGNIPAGN